MGMEIWKIRERNRPASGQRGGLRKELIGLPDTIQDAQRGEEISLRMHRLWVRYKELGGILYGSDPH
jgi:hypothetical protein